MRRSSNLLSILIATSLFFASLAGCSQEKTSGRPPAAKSFGDSSPSPVNESTRPQATRSTSLQTAEEIAKKGREPNDVLRSAKASTGGPFAVVELFTSEGCSSCPPADKNLRELAEAAPGPIRIYPLSFHVDYWNRLGWEDPFSQSKFSTRQRWYAGSIGEGRVYTPQMVVNGTRQFVGSSKRDLSTALEEATKRAAVWELKLEARAFAEEWEIRAKLIQAQSAMTDEVPEPPVVQLAVVDRSASVDVPRGENGGRTLLHANIVRQFYTIRPKANVATARIQRATEDQTLIAYAQGTSSPEVIGATELHLN